MRNVRSPYGQKLSKLNTWEEIEFDVMRMDGQTTFLIEGSKERNELTIKFSGF